MPRHATQELLFSLRDFSRAVIGGISERGIAKPNWLAGADNLYGRPFRSTRVRPGSRDLSSDVLPEAPHSLLGYYAGGGNKLFVAAGKNIYEVGSGSYALQTPATAPTTSELFSHTNLDGVLVAAQRGATITPAMYDGTWKDLKLPAPTLALTFAADDNIPAGAVDAGAGGHYYRVRWRYAHGSSAAGPASVQHVVTAPNLTVHIATNLTPASPRSDYVGWTLERTKVNGTATGPWWFVADGTAATYADVNSDASLGYMADEGLHGIPPALEGVTNFAGRLFGWASSTAYASQAAYGDTEGTGIANFDADNVYPVAKDDGDTIQVCLVVLNELLILKRRSVHVISGVDPDSFVLTSVVLADPSRGSEAGCAGPRAACVIGGAAYFWGESGGLFKYERGSVKPVGWIEMGRYLDTVNPGALDSLLLVNHQGNFMLAWYPVGASTVARDQLIYDARLKQWWHWVGWSARDAIELKSGILAGAQMAIADPTNRASFPGMPNGSGISGSGIPALATVVGVVVNGAQSLVISAPATLTNVNVTLNINGTSTLHCQTTLGSTLITIGGYHCWAVMEGHKDERLVDGTGGAGVTITAEPPWLDAGLPDDWKDLERIAITSDGDQTAVNVAIQTDPGGGETAVQLTTSGQGLDWSPPTGSGSSNDLEWDVGDWATNEPGTVVGGLPFGTIGRRFKAIVTGAPTGDYQLTGLEFVGTLLPDKEFNL